MCCVVLFFFGDGPTKAKEMAVSKGKCFRSLRIGGGGRCDVPTVVVLSQEEKVSMAAVELSKSTRAGGVGEGCPRVADATHSFETHFSISDVELASLQSLLQSEC